IWNIYCLALVQGAGRVSSSESCSWGRSTARKLTLLGGKMSRRLRLDNIVTATTAMLVILGIAISQLCVDVVIAANVDSGGYEMRVHLDRTLSITSSRVGDRFS